MPLRTWNLLSRVEVIYRAEADRPWLPTLVRPFGSVSLQETMEMAMLWHRAATRHHRKREPRLGLGRAGLAIPRAGCAILPVRRIDTSTKNRDRRRRKYGNKSSEPVL